MMRFSRKSSHRRRLGRTDIGKTASIFRVVVGTAGAAAELPEDGARPALSRRHWSRRRRTMAFVRRETSFRR